MRQYRFSPLAKIGGILCFFLLLFVVIKVTRTVIDVQRQTGISIPFVFRLFFKDGAPLLSSDDKVTLLLLGHGGGNHEGADLTDTMMVITLDPKYHTAAMIALPRDIWSDTLRDKINSAYHYGEMKKKGEGFILSKTIAEDVIGIPIHYTFLIDFSQFETVINMMGGIEITVPTAFTDTQYPIAGKENDLCNGDKTYACRYETVRFSEGLQYMDGATALKYVRSRHAEGEEGTDFARGKRQQDVIVAMKEKMLKLKLWLRPGLALRLWHAFDDATDTDMTTGELMTIGKQLMQIQESKMKKFSIESLFITAPPGTYGGLYVLLPIDTWKDIHKYIQQQLLQ